MFFKFDLKKSSVQYLFLVIHKILVKLIILDLWGIELFAAFQYIYCNFYGVCPPKVRWRQKPRKSL